MREPSTFRLRQAQSGRFGARAGARPRPTRPRPRARFLEGRAKTLSVLEVDFPLAAHSPDRLRRALFALRIQVIAEIRQQIGGRVVHWMRVVEFDGAPISESRGLALHRDLIGLLEDAAVVRRASEADYAASVG